MDVLIFVSMSVTSLLLIL